MSEWKCVKLGEVFKHRKQFIVIDDSKEYKRCRVQLHRRGVTLRDIVEGREIKTKEQQICRNGDFIFAEMDAKVGGYGFITEELDGAIVSSHYYLFEVNEDLLLRDFLRVLIKTDIIQSQIKAKGSTNYASVRPKEVLDFEIPLPSIAKQIEIIRTFEKYEKINNSFFEEIIVQQRLLKQLRQAILQEAVQGKLTADWRRANPEVEPAADLLKRIQAEKTELIKGQKIEQEEQLPPIKFEEIPFELSEKWTWCRIKEVCLRIVDCLHSTPKFKETGHLCIDTNCIRPGIIMHEKIRFVDEGTFQERNRRMKPCKDDVLFSREGALLGIAVKVPDNLNFCLGQRMMIFRLHNGMEPDYFEYILNSMVIRSQYIDKITGSASPHLNIRDIRKLYIPFPPIEEQKAIVAKVDKLMTYCNELERQIAFSQTTAEQVMQAVLREAFAAA